MNDVQSEAVTTKRVWELLDGVKDPEIPVVSVVELGLIADVALHEKAVTVKLTPSFIACPAIGYLQGWRFRSTRRNLKLQVQL